MTISLADVVQNVSSKSYLVLENALQVYQAKEAISVARGNLLPKLNVWKLVKVPFDPLALVDMVEDIAPFLVPNNWFRLSEQKILFHAQTMAYQALWANEVMTAKSLFLHSRIDQALLDSIKQEKDNLQSVLELVKVRELVGGLPSGTAKDIEVRLLGLEEDTRSLNALLTEEKSLLAYSLGLKDNPELILLAIALPNYDGLQPLTYDDFEYRAVSSSPELRQFDDLISAADYVKQEAAFSFLGVSNMSRGVAGGVFDGLPMQEGLGFGTSSSINISKAQKEILKTQRTGVEQTVKRALKLMVDTYNLDLESYSNLKRRADLTRDIQDDLYSRLRLGESIDALSLVEASRNHIQAEVSLFSVQYRFVSTQDRLARLIFYGDYSKSPKDPLALLQNGGSSK